MVDYTDLRTSLYVPANHPKLAQGLFDEIMPQAPSYILCTEDSLADSELPLALRQVSQLLPLLARRRSTAPIFLRPRNVDVLREFLSMPGIENVVGFVIPKADVDSLPGYAELLVGLPYRVMPVLETRSIFDEMGRVELREFLKRSPLGPAVLALRIGGNDLLRLLGLKRQAGVSIYQTPLGALIPQLMMCFRPHGFQLTGVVCDSLNDADLLRNEAVMDARMGLIGKTAIHPVQVPIFENVFSVSREDVFVAEEILRDSSRSVMAFNQMMLERTVHAEWAKETLLRGRRSIASE
jgi:citrate lyase beta subunit